MEVGEKLRKLRTDRNMTTYRLTRLTGVSGHHIKGIEEGTRQPTIETLRRLTEALGSSLADIFSDGEEALVLSENERKLVKNYRMMSSDKAEALLLMSDVLNK